MVFGCYQVGMEHLGERIHLFVVPLLPLDHGFQEVHDLLGHRSFRATD